MYRSNNIWKLSSFVAVLLMLMVAVADAEPTERAVEDSMARLSVQYIKVFPADGMKKGLSVLPFEEGSDSAQKKGLGTTMRDLFSGKILQSRVFYLIDRDTFKQRLRETELSMSGLIDEKTAIEAGREAGVHAFLAGSISEAGEDFQISTRIIDVETGRIIAQDTFKLHQKRLVAKQREIAFSYISKYGIGINIQQSFAFLDVPLQSGAFLTDVFVSYRPVLWLNIKLGATYFYLDMWDESAVLTDTLFTNYTDEELFPFDGAGDMTMYSQGQIKEALPYIGIEYNLMFSDRFAVAVGAGASIFYSNFELVQVYNGAPERTEPKSETDPKTDSFTRSSMELVQSIEPTVMLRFEVRPQFFISPRATVGLYLAYLYTPSLTVESTDFGNTTLYPHDPAGATDPADMNLGFDPLQVGLVRGDTVEDNMNLSGFAAGLSVSFYF